jgi:hypothetical protein
MPKQETFLREAANGVEVEVIKTYDKSYAHEVFRGISPDALEALVATLGLGENYEASDIPTPENPDYEDFIWEEVCDAAREDVRLDPNLFSFFVVIESSNGKSEDVYVSPDWPNAEAFARRRLTGA